LDAWQSDPIDRRSRRTQEMVMEANLAVSKHYFRFWTQSGHGLCHARTIKCQSGTDTTTSAQL